jgi:dTDP-4-dehydrorhamnose 3,5-epimerase
MRMLFVFKVENTSIEEVKRFVSEEHIDERGSFFVKWEKEQFESYGIKESFTQDNFSISKRNVLRGIHYQVGPFSQGKLVHVVRGSVYDVAVDIRPMSKTFGQWHGEILSEENRAMLWIPPGFGHGFLVLSDVAEFSYKCSGAYNKKAERTIAWNDPKLNISWPLGESSPILSEKDSNGLSFDRVREEEFSILFDYFVF